MTDPGNGEMPAKIGASAVGPSEISAKSAADGRRSRKGNAPFDTDPAAAGASDRKAAESARRDPASPAGGDLPVNGDIPAKHGGAPPNAGGHDDLPRKRKRRRRSRGAKRRSGDAALQAAGAAASADAGGGKPVPGPHSGKARKKKHRALQGRPLNCAGNSSPSSRADAAEARSSERGGSGGSRDAKPPLPAGVDGRAGNGFHKISLADDGRSGSGSRPSGAGGVTGGGLSTPLYAALDLGTNNCRLLIAQPTRPGQFRVVDAFSRIVRLGEGLARSGQLSQGAMDRAVEALKVCAAKLQSRPIRSRRLIATEACRRAANGAEFLARVRAETGLDLEVVDRETEARLAVSGCASLVGHDARSVVLFDIGGGSSEIAVIALGGARSNRLANHIKAWTSLPVGVVTLSEQHGGREVTPDIFAAMVSDVEAMLARFDCPVGLTGHDGGAAAGFHLLGTSGTVTTLAGVYLDLPRYDRRRVDGLWLTNADVDRMVERLLSWDFDERSANPCIGAQRADLVLAGCAILEAIRRRWPAERMRVADRGLREGLLTEMMAADGIWRRPRRRPRWRGSSAGQGAS